MEMETVVYSTVQDIGSRFIEVVVEITRIGDTDQYIYRKAERSHLCNLPLHECAQDDMIIKRTFTSLYSDPVNLYESLRDLTAGARLDKAMIEMFNHRNYTTP